MWEEWRCVGEVEVCDIGGEVVHIEHGWSTLTRSTSWQFPLSSWR